jgi:hypothetical protein
MSLKKLVNPGAFGQGAELWIVGDPETSPWARKIDWYLNLQIRRAKGHKALLRAEPLQKILSESEMELPEYYRSSETSLLISSRDHLPSRCVLHIPINDPNRWLSLALRAWTDLKEPTVRFFLPEGITEEQFESFWPKHKHSGVSFVLPQSPVEDT